MQAVKLWRVLRFRLVMVAVLVVVLPVSSSFADPITQVGSAQRGRLQFIFTGASLAQSAEDSNGLSCLKSVGAANVAQSDVPSTRAKLVSATLYVGGSLFDDGVDVPATGEKIFDGQGRRYDQASDQGVLTQEAKAQADRAVLFKPPGAAFPVEVQAGLEQVNVALRYKVNNPEQGNQAFFVTAIDVTQAIQDAGGRLEGTYEVSGLRADVCNGEEAQCDAGEVCGSTHTRGAASFALLLVVEDPTLPLSTIAVYDGLQLLNGASLQVNLTGGISISNPAQGAFAFYALEGDLGLGVPDSSAPCNAAEYIEVDGDNTPTVNGLCLTDDDNPIGNLFNSTINVQAAVPSPDCLSPSYQCCLGDGVCGETGVDIDRFDISAALAPGAQQVRVQVGSGSDTIALAAMVLQVSIFEPILTEDSKIRVISTVTENEEVLIGGTDAARNQLLTLSLGISNTGNIPATGVEVLMNAPPGVTDFAVPQIPPGATNNSTFDGGANFTGSIDVKGFTVAPGEVAEIRATMVTECTALNTSLSTAFTVKSQELTSFVPVAGPTLTPRGPGVGTCAGVDPEGPFASEEATLERDLRGGGGCSTLGSATGGLMLLTLLGFGRMRRRRQRRSTL